MDWTAIIVAFIAMAGTGFGSFYGIKKSNSLIEYRMDELTKKVELHNDVVVRMFEAEKALDIHCEQIKVANHRLQDLEGHK